MLASKSSLSPLLSPYTSKSLGKGIYPKRFSNRFTFSRPWQFGEVNLNLCSDDSSNILLHLVDIISTPNSLEIEEINGKADIIRWEILYHYGGLFVDADSICIESFDFLISDK